MKTVNVNNEQRERSMAGALPNIASGSMAQWAFKVLLALAIVLVLCSAPFVAMQWVAADNAIDAQPAEQPSIAEQHGLAPGARQDFNQLKCPAGQEQRGTVYGDGSWAGWQCLPIGY